eukprot:15171649-Alexandrium_andersonii.AAC.1
MADRMDASIFLLVGLLGTSVARLGAAAHVPQEAIERARDRMSSFQAGIRAAHHRRAPGHAVGQHS